MSGPIPDRAAFQGVAGAFSHEACLALLPGVEPWPCPTFEAAMAAVRDGACGLALLPIENSIAGAVPEMAALLPRCGLRVVAEHLWPIRIQLMGVPGAGLEEVRTVASHPMALKQCGRFLRARGLLAEGAFDTAGAAAEIARSGDPSRAAAAPRPAAALYGLAILAEDIQDTGDNTTRFLVLAR